MSETKERPILFSGPMVRAILEGRKTQTRRVIKSQPPANCSYLTAPKLGEYADGVPRWAWTDGATCDYAWHPWIGNEPAWQTCPYGVYGDRLRVKETSIISPPNFDFPGACSHPRAPGGPRIVQYLASNPDREAASGYGLKATPSIYMPRWASRITLEITDMRVQRLQEMSNEDASAEGVIDASGGPIAPDGMPRLAFRHLWNSINAKRGFGWDKNPWVWVITFKSFKRVAA